MAMNWVLRAVIAFEAFRLVGWVIFISYLAFGYSVAEGRENEALVLVHMGALYLGFPYSWLGSLLTAMLHTHPSSPLATAVIQFAFWAVGSALLIWFVRLGLSRFKGLNG
jgi:hypothetical protein